MTKHFIREIDKVKSQILELSRIVEGAVANALDALATRNAVLAQSVINADEKIDQAEIEIEEECLKILALYQPVAIDLRFVVAVLKINNDLERIGDLAVNIANRANNMSKLPEVESPFNIELLATKTRSLLAQSLVALLEMNVEKAAAVCAADDEVDQLNREAHQRIQDYIKKNPATTEQMILYLSVSRNLERIADHATNIAEDVIYMNKGEIVRHRLL